MKKSFMIFIFICILSVFSLPLALADVTVSDVDTITLGNKRGIMANIAFDSSYAYGGEALSGVSFGMSAIDRVFVEAKEGYTFEYDHTNNKLKVYTKAPPIVYEEKHVASTSENITLDYPAAYIVAVVNSGGTAYPLTYAGTTTMGVEQSTLPNGIEDNVRTAVSTYGGSGTYHITYATQAWQDLYKLLVQNELLTGTGITRYTASGNTIFAWMCGKYDGDTTDLKVIERSDTAGTQEIGVDFGDYVAAGHSGATQAVCLVSTSSKQVYASYLKHPGDNSFLAQRYIRDEDATSGTSIHSLDRPLLLWLQGQYVTLTGDPPHRIVLENQPAYWFNNKNVTANTSGISEINTNWGYRGGAADAAAQNDLQVWASEDEANGTDLTHATYLFGHPWEIPNLKPLEVVNGANLSDLTGVKVLVIGY